MIANSLTYSGFVARLQAGLGEEAVVLDGDLVELRIAGAVEEERAQVQHTVAADLAFDEDSYGYSTLEAFHAHKPVITLTDSGGSLEVIQDGHNGYVCEPEPRALAEAMNKLWNDRTTAKKLGENAYATLERYGIHWDRVIEKLTS